MSFWTAVVAVVAIMAGAAISMQKHKYKNHSAGSSEITEVLEKEIEDLKARIATLETIVTDPGYDLKKQFRDLEDDKVA